MIKAASFQDPLLDAVRQTVRGMTDDVPVALLPVRLETRFMTRERPARAQDYGALNRLLERIPALAIRLFSPPAGDPAVWLKASAKEALTLQQELPALGQVTRRHKEMLTNLAREVVAAANELPPSNPPEGAEKVKKACGQLLAATQKLTAVPDPEGEEARTYLDDFRKLAARLDQLAAGMIPYTNPKNKRDLYDFVETLTGQIQRQYQYNVWQADRIRRVEQRQLDRIRELHQRIRQHCQALPDWFKPLHADKNWQGFIQRTREAIQQRLVPLFEAFEAEVMPLLHYLTQIPRAELTEMTFSAARLWLNTEKANRLNFDHYHTIRQARKKTIPNVDHLQVMSAKAVTGSPEQVEALQSLWRKAGESMTAFSRKVNTVDTPNPSHRFGIETTVAFVDEKAQTAAGVFTDKPAATIDLTRPLDFYLSFRFFNDARKAIEALLQKADQGAGEEVLDHDLGRITDDFRIAGRKSTVLTEDNLRELRAAVRRLRTALGGNVRFHVKLALIEEALAGFNATVTDKKSDWFEDFRRRPVWSQPATITDELWVRIYPDQLFIQTHEPGLTAQESAEGKKYWKSWWLASGDPDLELGAWRALSAVFGAHRAAWVAHALDPRDNPQNAARLKASPSVNIRQVIQILDDNAGRTAKFDVAGGATAAFMSRVQGLQITRLADARALLTGVATEQVFLLEKAGTQLQRIGVRLSEIAARMDKLTAAQKQQFAAIFTTIAARIDEWKALFAVLQGIEALDGERFSRQFPDEPFLFPETEHREAAFNRAPRSPALPGRFVVATQSHGVFQHLVVGAPIPEDLELGLKPVTADDPGGWRSTPEGELETGDGIRWMTDFEEAVEKGMGLIVPLTREEKLRGFDKLYALGIRDNSFDLGAGQLKEVLDSHHYAPLGMAFLPPGTPTNHSEGEPSGWKRLDADPATSYQVEMGAPLYPDALPSDPYGLADGRRLANALGLPASTFQHVYQAGGGTISNAQAMHQALWHGTVGSYLTEMWNTTLTVDNIDRTRQFFEDNVIARGSLPSLRIGRQPYGFLPTTAFSRMTFAPGADIDHLPQLTPQQVRAGGPAIEPALRLRWDIRFHRFLQLANGYFSAIRQSEVKHAGNVGAKDPQRHFIEMLGLNATSVDYFVRFAANAARRGKTGGSLPSLDLDPEAAYSANSIKALFSDLLDKGYFARSFDFSDEFDLPPLNPLIAKWARIHRQVDQAQLFRQRFMEKCYEVRGSLVAAVGKPEDHLPLLTGQNLDYIEWLLRAVENDRDLYRLINGTGDSDKPAFPANNLLFLLLKQSLMEAFTEAALDILQQDGFFSEVYRRRLTHPEFMVQRNTSVGKFYGITRHSWLIKDLEDLQGINGFDLRNFPLYKHLSAGQRKKNMADYLVNESNLFSSYAGNVAHRPHAQRFGRITAAMRRLRQAPVTELTQLLVEHIDLCTHRLDAWVLGLANRRLSEVRASQPSGVYIGAYGWLEDLRPGPGRGEAPEAPAELAGERGQAVYQDNANQGFIHAPSTGQAIAAAILRAGYRANAGFQENLTNTFSVNLSSARVRSALYLIEGVRNGNELGALLGYQLERGLHERYQEAEMDKFILPLRLKYPLVAPIEDAANGATSAANVVNGLSLLEEVKTIIENLDFPPGALLFDLLTQNNFQHTPAPIRQLVQANGGNDTHLRVLLKEIDRMADALDALGDIALSESVYQLVQGNHVRAAAVVSALAEGRALPDPEVVNTPRTGTVVTQRVTLHLTPRQSDGAPPPQWPDRWTPRALAEPSLNHWLGERLGDPASVRCLVTYAIGEDSSNAVITLSDLGLQPLDALYLINFTGESAVSELESRCIAVIQALHPGETLREVALHFQQRDETWDAGVLTFFEFETLARALRDLLANAAPVGSTEMTLPTAAYDRLNPGRQLDVELSARALAAADELATLHAGIAAWLEDHQDWNEAPPAQADLSQAILLAVQAAELNISNAYPGPEMWSSPKSMFLHLVNLGAAAKRTLATVAPLREQAGRPEPGVKDRVLTLVEIVKTIFGKTFPVLPHYQLGNFAEVDQQLQLPAGAALLRHHTPSAMDEWAQGIALVRPALFALESAVLMSEAFGVGFPAPAVLQFPYQDGDYWAGLELPEDYSLNGDKLSIVALNTAALTNDVNCGLVIDEWIEIIPSKTETTGLSFHYDQPNAEPPQTVLLAVTPQRTGNWEWDHLLYTLEDTLELAKNRAVEPDHIERSPFQQVLPALITESVPDTLRDLFAVLYKDAIHLDMTKLLIADADQ